MISEINFKNRLPRFAGLFAPILFICLSGCNFLDRSPNVDASFQQPLPGNFGILSLLNQSQTIGLSWSASSNATAYDIYRATGSPPGAFSVIATNATSPYNDSTVIPGVFYTYQVMARGTGGHTPSQNGSDASGHFFTSQASLALPPSPFSILIIEPGDAEVALTWSAAPGTSNYIVRRGTSSGNYSVVVSRNATSPFTDTGVTNTTTYYYMVEAQGIGGNTNANAEVSATPLPPPTAFSITSATPGVASVTLAWSPSTYASSYTVTRGTTSGSYPTVVSTTATSPFVDSTVTNGTTYYYMVTAIGVGGRTNASAEASATPQALPGSFTLSSMAGNGQVTVNWTNSTNAVSYTLERGTVSGSYPTVLSTNAASSYVDTSVSNGVTYYYMVVAVGTTGDTDATEETSATPLPAPTSFSFTGAIPGNAQVILTWQNSQYASSYTLQRGTTSGSYPTTVSTDATSGYTDTGLTNGTTYYYFVTAVGVGGNTPVNAETSAIPLPPPGSFAITSAVPGTNQVTLTWGNSTNATSYTISRGTTSGSYPTTVSVNAFSPYTDTGLTNGTTYYYMVTAVGVGGSTNANAEASATIDDPPAAFSILGAGPGNNQAFIFWESSQYATSYTITRGTTSGSYPTTVSSNATSPYTDSTVSNGTTYYYMVTAVNTGNSTDATTQASVTPGEYNIFVTDSSNNRIVAMSDMTGANFLGFGTSGSGTNQFSFPTDVALDSSGNIYVSDNSNSRIVMMTNMTGAGWTTLGTHGTGTNKFQSPIGLALDSSNNIYVADYIGDQIISFSNMTGTGWTTYGSSGSGTGNLSSPSRVAVNTSGQIFIADQGNSRIVRIDNMTGANEVDFGTQGSGVNQFDHPAGVRLDSQGRIYVTDKNNQRIVRFDDMTGTNWVTFGSSGSSTDEFTTPYGLCIGSSSQIYVLDEGISHLTRFDDMTGTNWTTYGSAGTGTGHFSGPFGVNCR